MSATQVNLATVVMQFVCQRYHQDAETLRGPSREWEILWARWVAMYLMRTELGMTKSQIGYVLHRDRTTIINALVQVDNWVESSCAHGRDLAAAVVDFRGRVGANQAPAELAHVRD